MGLRRLFRLAFAGVIVVIALSACAPPPSNGGSWLVAGTCYGSTGPGTDFTYEGPVNSLGNITVYDSTDDLCGGTALGAATVVKANDATGANQTCHELNPAFGSAVRLVDFQYAVPTTVWSC